MRQLPAITAANWQDQRKMTGGDLRSVIGLFGISISGAARFCGVSARNMRRMLIGEAEVPTSISRLFYAMLAAGYRPVVPAWSKDQN